MKWFKTLWLSSAEREALKRSREPEAYQQLASGVSPSTKPYKNLYYSNKNLTAVMHSGIVFSKSNVIPEDFVRVRDAVTEQEVENFFVERYLAESIPTKSNAVETINEKILVTNSLEILRKNSDFEVQGDQVFLKGVNLTIPTPVVASFIEILEKLELTKDLTERENLYKQYYALKMFWLKLALNPLPKSREDLLVFVKNNDVRITNNGNLILYRRIVTVGNADKELVSIITQEYYKAKKAGADPRNFAIAKGDDRYYPVDLAHLVDSDIPKLVGNLQVLYLELPNMDTNTFTASHDRRMKIQIGGIYKIAETEINLDNSICAAGGLHAAAVNYNYSGFGDMPVVVLVNPSKAITVPRGEIGKLRTTEMFIACVNDKPQGVHFDDSGLTSFDTEYHDLSLSELEEVAKSKSFENLSVKDNVPAVSLVDINKIKEMLKSRIVKI